MKKRLLTALAVLCLLAVPVIAATTTHYSFVLPTVGASQNVWGTVLNTAFNGVDTAIWNASQGTTIGVNAPSASASNITLTNPINNIQQIAFTGTGKSLFLPAMNATASLVVGGTVVIQNTGSYAFAITSQDTSTVIVPSLAPGQFVRLTLDANGTANGTFTVEGPYLTAVGTIAVGTSAVTANPTISGDITSGFYSPGASTLAVTAGGVEVQQWNTVSSAVDYISTSPSTSGNSPVIATAGTDTNIGLTLTPKGSGTILSNGPTSVQGSLSTSGAVSIGSSLSVSTTMAVTGVSSLNGGGTSTTQSAGDNSTNIATTAYVDRGASGASLVLLSTQTASSSASISFGSLSGYNEYILYFDSVVPGTNNAYFSILFSENNCSTFLNTSYNWSGFTANYGASGTTVGAVGANSIYIGGSGVTVSNSGGFSMNGHAVFYHLGSPSLYKNVEGNFNDIAAANGGNTGSFGGTYLGDANAVNCIGFFPNTGNITSGNFSLYGVRYQ